ncbi:MAG: two-component regulator propeller domain-containing protein [Cyclobacteriaceae bacterium]
MFWIVMLWLSPDGYAQRARLFTTDVELSNSLIQDIHQDHKGIIWIATEDGLNKYDGNKFTIYKQETDGILHNYVRRLYEDQYNNLFIGYFNGLQLYDRAEDSFTNIPLILQSGSVYNAHVLSISQRQNGEIWVASSGHGIFILDSENDSIVGHQKMEIVPSRYIYKIFEDSQENVWVLTQDMGLFLISGQGEEKRTFALNTEDNNNVSSICEDSEGNIYVGSLNRGLLKYNSSLEDFSPIIDNSSYGSLPVVSLDVVANDKILVGTDGEGLKLYDPVTENLTDLNFNISNFDFSKTKIHDILQDRDGNYWLGLFQKGVALIPSRANNFNYIGYQSVSTDLIGSNYIMSIMEDSGDGTIWVGTDSDGLYHIQPPNIQIDHYNRDEHAYAPKTVMSMIEDSQGTFWIGSYIEGLVKFDKKKQKFTPFEEVLDIQGSPISRITDFTEDQNSNLWVSTLGFGVYSIDLNTGKINNYNEPVNDFHPNDATNSLHNRWVSCLMASSDNKVYIGTMDGLSLYDVENRNFRLLNNVRGIFWGHSIQTLFEDNAGIIWVGTTSGLFSYDPENEWISKYTTDEGLPSNGICSIEEDQDKNLWVSTNYGISKFDRAQDRFSNYYYHDGIQGNEFSRKASLKSEDGYLYFTGINGITYFDPHSVDPAKDSLDIELVGFYIQNTAVKKGLKSGGMEIISKSLIDADTFKLSHEDNSFSIEFSSLEYLNPDRIQYAFCINGEDWISLQPGVNNMAFNNLKPGDYLIRVRAQDFNAFSNIRTLRVMIHPPWYLSGWAKAGYAAFCLALIWAIGIYLKQRQEHKERLRQHLQTRQINEAKLEFFTNISHEIRTPLSLILNPIQKLLSTDTDARRQRNYNVIRRNTEKILHLVNQLMDLRQIDRGRIKLRFRETNIVDFVKETVEIFEESIIAKHLTFNIHSEPGIPKIWIDQNYFDKTIQNVLSNAIKFTPENREIVLEIKVGDDAQSLFISCTDQGIGLKEDDLEKIFDRFYQVGEARKESVGNGIGLHLTRSILEMHYGVIYAENNPDGIGSRFVIQLPLGNAHLQSDEIDTNIEEAPNKHNFDDVAPSEYTSPSAEEQKIKSKTKFKVLVVDDDVEIREYVANELSEHYSMLLAETGKEGLSVVLELKPDLVISDVVMPEMDGIDLCKKIKQNVNINHIPVILLTAKSSESDNLQGLGIGADAYISKPFNMEILKKTVDNLVKNRELLKNNYRGNQEQNDKVKQVEMESADERLLQKMMQIINENIDNPELNVEMIASEIGISRVHLYRKLKELTNQSVRDLIKNIRLKQASDLLLSKNLSVSEVGYATGFSNPSKFSTSFKDFYGVSPSTYVARERQKRTTTKSK